MRAEIRFVPICFSNIPWNVAESGIQFFFSPHDCSPQLQGDNPQITIAIPEEVFIPVQHVDLLEIPLAMTFQLPSREYWTLKESAKVHLTDMSRKFTRSSALDIEPSQNNGDVAIPDERFSSTALSGGWEIYNMAQFFKFPSCAGEYSYHVCVTMGNNIQSNIVTMLIHIFDE